MNSRKYLAIVLGVFLLIVLAIILSGTFQGLTGTGNGM